MFRFHRDLWGPDFFILLTEGVKYMSFKEFSLDVFVI